MKLILARRETFLTLSCFVLVIAILTLRWAFATYALPTDAIWSANDGPKWMVAIVEWLNGSGFSNPLTNYYTEPHWRDGQFSMVAYPPLHMLLLATLSTDSDVFEVYRAIWRVESIGLIFLLLALLSILFRSRQQHRITMWVLVIASLLCAGTLGFSGRPDTTFVALLSLGCLYASVALVPNSVIVGMLLGVMGATQPTTALIVAACVIIWYSMLWTGHELVRRLSILAIISILLFTVAIGTYYNPVDVLLAMGRNSSTQFFAYFTPELFLQAQMLDYWRPLSGLTLFTGAIALTILLLCQDPKSVWGLLVGTCALALLSTHAFVLRPHCTYNSLAMLPVILIVTLVAAAESNNFCRLSCIALGLSALALPLQAALLHDHVSRGITLKSAQSIYTEVVDRLPSDSWLGISSQLWPLSSDGGDWDRSFHINWAGPRNRDASNSALFIGEGRNPARGNSLLAFPRAKIRDHPEAINHRLWLDCNTKKLVRILGRNIYTPVKGFGFSVYVPIGWRNWCPSDSECYRAMEVLESCNVFTERQASKMI